LLYLADPYMVIMLENCLKEQMKLLVNMQTHVLR